MAAVAYGSAAAQAAIDGLKRDIRAQLDNSAEFREAVERLYVSMMAEAIIGIAPAEPPPPAPKFEAHAIYGRYAGPPRYPNYDWCRDVWVSHPDGSVTRIGDGRKDEIDEAVGAAIAAWRQKNSEA